MPRPRDDDERAAAKRRGRALRLFVAVHPPPEIAAQMLGLVDVAALPPGRLVPVGQVHLTLQFIGAAPPGSVAEIVESITRAACGLPEIALTPLELIALPERGPARLLAVRTDCPPGLAELKRRLVVRLARHARAEPARGFLPHLTVCRLRVPSRLSPLARVAPLPCFPVREVTLMRSVLRPQGARHDEVARVALDGPP